MYIDSYKQCGSEMPSVDDASTIVDEENTMTRDVEGEGEEDSDEDVPFEKSLAKLVPCKNNLMNIQTFYTSSPMKDIYDTLINMAWDLTTDFKVTEDKLSVSFQIVSDRDIATKVETTLKQEKDSDIIWVMFELKEGDKIEFSNWYIGAWDYFGGHVNADKPKP